MNKLTKLLSVFVIAGCIGTGIAGAAGCKKPSNNEHTEHKWSYTDNKDGTHDATCDGCDEKIDNQAHVWGPGDKCVCGAEKPTQTVDKGIVSVTISAEGDKKSIKGNGVDSVKLSATVVVKADQAKTVTWRIEDANGEAVTDTEVASLVDGVFTAKVAGNYTVYATSTVDDEVEDYYDITVERVARYDTVKALGDKVIVDSATWEDVTDNLSKVTTPGTKGIYGQEAESVITVANKVATTNGAGFFIDFGTTGDVIEGTLTVKVKAKTGTGFGMIRLMNRTWANTDDYSLSGRDNGQYRINRGTTNISSTEDNFNFSYQDDTDIEVYFKFDKPAGTAELWYDTSCLYRGAVEETDIVGVGIFGKAKTAGNTLEVKSVAIATYDVSDAEYATAMKNKVAALNKEATDLKGEAWASTATETALSDALTAANNALNVENVTKAASKTAYETYETAVLAALRVEYKAKLVAKYPAANYDTDSTEYNSAMDTAEAAFGGVTEVAGFAGVYAEQDALLAKVLTNAQMAKPKVIIEIYNGATKVGMVNVDKNGAELKVGGVVTIEAIKAACEGIYVEKVFIDEGKLTELTGDYTTTGEGSADTTLTVKLYVQVGTRVAVSIDSGLEKGMTFTPSDTSIQPAIVDKDNLLPDTLASGTTGKFVAGSMELATGLNIVLTQDGKAKFQSATVAESGYAKVFNTGSNSTYISMDIKSACKITVKFSSSKANDTTKNDRVGAIKATNSKAVPGAKDNLAEGIVETASTLISITANITEAGTYYFTCGGAIDIYDVIIEYGAATEGGGEEVTPPTTGGEEATTPPDNTQTGDNTEESTTGE